MAMSQCAVQEMGIAGGLTVADRDHVPAARLRQLGELAGVTQAPAGGTGGVAAEKSCNLLSINRGCREGDMWI